MGEIVLLVILLSIVSCAGLYYDHSKSEWMSMTDEQQNKIKEDYSLVLQGKNTMARGDHINETTEAFTKRAVGRSGE